MLYYTQTSCSAARPTGHNTGLAHSPHLGASQGAGNEPLHLPNKQEGATGGEQSAKRGTNDQPPKSRRTCARRIWNFENCSFNGHGQKFRWEGHRVTLMLRGGCSTVAAFLLCGPGMHVPPDNARGGLLQQLRSSSVDFFPMASGLARGSRSANRLNQADMSFLSFLRADPLMGPGIAGVFWAVIGGGP